MRILFGFPLLLSGTGGKASNLQLSALRLVDQDRKQGTVFLQFDLSWDFSWKDRTHLNWDAAWVFAKCYDEQAGEWKQVHLVPPQGRPVEGGKSCFMALPHSIGEANVPVWSEFGNSLTDFGEKTVGCFIYRKDIGSGSNMIRNIRLQWNYVDDGFLPEDKLQVMIYAIEMVYIPANPFIIGDGASPQALYADGKNLIIKVDVLGAQSMYMGKIQSESGLTYQGIPVPDVFPKGYKAFYMMKYEISQHAYADFLNTLTVAQQTERCSASPASAKATLAMIPTKYKTNPTQYRNFIRIQNPSLPASGGKPATPAYFGHSVTAAADSCWNMEENGGNIACNFLSWNDGLAYLDWSCLRPMTELEYEKACRGTKFVRKEYAWAYQYGVAVNQAGKTAPYFLDPNLPSERPVDTNACWLQTGKAPWVMRVGGFATSTSIRMRSGATYYGVMNMSDNLWERCINVSTEEGRAFIPQEGDGHLDAQGYAEVFESATSTRPCWPEAAGGGFRGYQVSNRQYAQSTQVVNGEGDRTPYSGFRGVRAAPSETSFDCDK